MGKYRLIISQNAEKHLSQIKKSGNKAAMKKISELFIELAEHPQTGTGKPEPLRHEFQGAWSRRIDKKSRIVYRIDEEQSIVSISDILGHYGDK